MIDDLAERAADFRKRNPDAIRNPYDVSTWGLGAGTGIRYKDLGPVTDGQKGAVRKISTGRKARKMVRAGSNPSNPAKARIT